jgi:hypothetical protein
LQCKQIHFKLLEPYSGDRLSHSKVCYWSGQFTMGRKHVEDARRTGQHPISLFSFEFRVPSRKFHLHLPDGLSRPRPLL